MQNLHDLAARLDVKVKYGRFIVHGYTGHYDHFQRTIYLAHNLTTIGERVTLAHELGHAWYGHTESTPEAERQADVYAARLLISPLEYAAAEAICDHPGAIATELGVTRRLVLIYQRLLLPEMV